MEPTEVRDVDLATGAGQEAALRPHGIDDEAAQLNPLRDLPGLDVDHQDVGLAGPRDLGLGRADVDGDQIALVGASDDILKYF